MRGPTGLAKICKEQQKSKIKTGEVNKEGGGRLSVQTSETMRGRKAAVKNRIIIKNKQVRLRVSYKTDEISGGIPQAGGMLSKTTSALQCKSKGYLALLYFLRKRALSVTYSLIIAGDYRLSLIHI